MTDIPLSAEDEAAVQLIVARIIGRATPIRLDDEDGALPQCKWGDGPCGYPRRCRDLGRCWMADLLAAGSETGALNV